MRGRECWAPVSSLSFVASFSSHIPVAVSSSSPCLRVPPLSCPRSPSSLSCGCRGARCQRARREELGKGGAHRGVVSSFVVWRHGTRFPLADAGGFRGGGSCFCACGGPFVLVLGRSLSFGWSSSFVGGGGFSLTLGVSPRCVVVLSGCGRVAVWCLSFRRGRDRVVSSSVGGLG